MNPYLFLAFAIIAEVGATLALPLTQEFKRPLPSAIVIVAYFVSFYFMTLSLRGITIGMAYAVWSGVGIVGITTFAYLFHQQKQDLPAILGLALIISGILVIHLFSKTASIH